MGSVVEIVDGRRLSFNEGSVDAERTFILTGYSNESSIVYLAFGNQVGEIDNALNLISVPKIGDPHPSFPSLLFAYSYDLTQLPGESDKWRATFKYRRTETSVYVDNSAVGAGPGLVGFEELSARVSGSFVEAYRTDPGNFTGTGDGDIGGDPIDRAGVPTSVMRTQMEISLTRTMTTFDPGEFAHYVGTRTKQQLFGLNPGFLVYRGANISRIETNKFSVQHTWLYDKHYHLIQEPAYTVAGTPQLGKDSQEYDGKAYPVFHRQPFPEDDSHTLAPGY